MKKTAFFSNFDIVELTHNRLQCHFLDLPSSL